MQNLKRVLSRFLKGSQTSTNSLTTPVDGRVKSLLDCLSTTLDEEADCAQFDAQMGCLAELIAQGKLPAEVLTPGMEAHLLHSADCREEFDALVAILRAEEAGEFEQLS